MRVKFILPIAAASALIFGLTSCSKKKTRLWDGTKSTTTNWDYNIPENGGFEVAANMEQKTGPGLVLIEGGAFQMGRTEQEVMYNWDNQPRRVTVSSFYMDETEVRNVDYREYLHWIKRVFTDVPQVYRDRLPDTLVWRRPLAYNEPYVNYYFRHPAYNNYPVVGVDWLQASDYCVWRTDRVNEDILVAEGVLEHNPADQSGSNNFNTEAYYAGQYEGMVKQNLPNLSGDGERPVRMEDGILLPQYQLPTEAEWEYAALALIGNSETSPERIWAHRLYPWNGHYLRNDSKEELGQFRANFQRSRGDMMGVAGALNDRASITAEVDAYWPNDFGLYNMAGNVNEWVRDIYRPTSSTDYEDFQPFRGNVFQVMETNTDGHYVEKDSLGRMKYRDMTDDESMNRQNYQKAYNINYGDGDVESSVSDDWNAVGETSSSRMYRSLTSDKSGGYSMSSLITDHTRVYKGGGWRDRAYWLSPGTRRFLDQTESRDDIGFRCSMVRLGSPTGIVE